MGVGKKRLVVGASDRKKLSVWKMENVCSGLFLSPKEVLIHGNIGGEQQGSCLY